MLITAIIAAKIPHQIATIRDAEFESFFLNIEPIDANKRMKAEIIHSITQIFVIHGNIVV